MKKKYSIAVLLFLGLLGGVFFLYSQKTIVGPLADTRLQVTTSFYPLYYFSSEIGGEFVSVYNITPAGVEPHDYEPTAKDIARIEDSDILILNGLSLEKWIADVGKIVSNKVRVIEVGQTVVDQQGQIPDPHVWLDPVLVKQEVAQIEQVFISSDPVHSAQYKANAQKLIEKLNALDQSFRIGLASCEKKDIITSHAAFGYLAKEYDFNQISIAGLSPDEEPSLKDLARVSDLAKKEKISVIFFESLVSPKLSDTIAREIGAKSMVLNPIEGLSQEDLVAGKTYFTEMESNLDHLRIALICK